MYKFSAIALLLTASASAHMAYDDDDFVAEAANSADVDSYGEVQEPFMLGQGEGDAKPPAGMKVKGKKGGKKGGSRRKSVSSSDLGGSFVTPKISAGGNKPAATDYKVPNFGADFDIIATQKHIKDSEKKLKDKWTPKKKLPSYAMDYKVPNFGLDKDILDASASIKTTEKKLGKWNPKQDADGAWIVPVAFDNRSYGYNK